MTRKEAEEALRNALGPWFAEHSHSTMLTDEAVFSLRLIKALETLGLLKLDEP